MKTSVDQELSITATPGGGSTTHDHKTVGTSRPAPTGRLLTPHGHLPAGPAWSASIGEIPAPAYSIQTFYDHRSQAVYCCAFSPNGELVASVDRSNVICIKNRLSGTVKRWALGSKGFTMACAFDPLNRRVATGGQDGAVKVWDVATEARVARWKVHAGCIMAVAYSSNGTLATGGSDRLVIVSDPGTGRRLATLKGHHDAVSSVSWAHRDTSRVVSASLDGTTKIWDWQRRVQLMSFPKPSTDRVAGSPVWSACFDPSDSYVLTADNGGAAVLWDVTAQHEARPVRVFRGHGSHVRHAIFHPRVHKVLTASSDRTLKIWDIQTGACESTLIGHLNTVYCCDVFENTIVSCGADGIVKMWNKSNLMVPHSVWLADAARAVGEAAEAATAAAQAAIATPAAATAVAAAPATPEGTTREAAAETRERSVPGGTHAETQKEPSEDIAPEGGGTDDR